MGVVTSLHDLLADAASRAADHRAAAAERPVAPADVDVEALRARLGPLPDDPVAADVVVRELADGDTLHPVQQAWIDEDVAQCGYCQPGQIMAAAALLAETPHPTDADIDALENVCRCGTYVRIRRAIHRAAGT